jgi:glutamate-5-semialdehyde dehydrogenase
MNVQQYVELVVRQAKEASRALASALSGRKDEALGRMAEGLLARRDELKAANQKDVEAAQAGGLSGAMVDRLKLDDARIQAMADGIRTVISLRDPVGEVMDGTVRPNGLRIQKVRVPIGVILMIYESRPNVTADAASLCLKSGNAVILRGGKEALNSNLAIACVLSDALTASGLPAHAVQMVETPDRQVVDLLLRSNDFIDLVIPRGGESLIRAVVEKSTIPVIKHYKGVCHVYVDDEADLDMAERIALNAKVQRPGVCNAMETLLVHKGAAERFLPRIAQKMRQAGVELRGDELTRCFVPDMKPATEEDWYTEYLDLILSVRVVGSLDEAIAHIAKYGSSHTDAIVTNNVRKANEFVARVDSSAVLVNASTRLNDGGEFGLGAEIGISTDKIHARGPMGLEELTTYKWIVYGDGQVRT